MSTSAARWSARRPRGCSADDRRGRRRGTLARRQDGDHDLRSASSFCASRFRTFEEPGGYVGAAVDDPTPQPEAVRTGAEVPPVPQRGDGCAHDMGNLSGGQQIVGTGHKRISLVVPDAAVRPGLHGRTGYRQHGGPEIGSRPAERCVCPNIDRLRTIRRCNPTPCMPTARRRSSPATPTAPQLIQGGSRSSSLGLLGWEATDEVGPRACPAQGGHSPPGSTCEGERTSAQYRSSCFQTSVSPGFPSNRPCTRPGMSWM